MPILRILTTEVGASEQVLPLGDTPIRMGRADDNDLVLLERSASRHHARVEPSNEGYVVVDMDSEGGTLVDGAKVSRHILRDGDEVVIGGTRLRYVEHPSSENTIVPATEVPPSSLPTEVGALPSQTPTPAPAGATPVSAPVGDADTIPPEPAASPPAADASATVAAPHQPATPPKAAPMPPSPDHNSSNDSFVFGGGSSSPSDYTLGSKGSPGASGGYSMDGARDERVGSVSIDTVPPSSTLRRGPGAGTYVLVALVGAAASFGILVALQGAPW